MGTVHSFRADNIFIDHEKKKFYSQDEYYATKGFFEYDIICRHQENHLAFLFNMKKMQMMIVAGLRSESKLMAIMPFWLEGDRPIVSVKWIQGQERYMDEVMQSFQDQYAARILDGIINS